MGKRKLHEFINEVENKHCGKCNQWKLLDQFGKNAQARDGKHYYCKACVNKKIKQRRKVMKEKHKKEREAVAPTGFLVCLKPSCKKGLQPVDQFIGPYVRDDKPTSYCQTCRDKQKEADKQRQAECQKVWDEYRKTHPCVICNQDPEHEHNPLLIEADHLPEFIPTLGVKLKACSDHAYWCHSKRGPAKLRKELKKCQALCVFHHALVTWERINKTEKQSILRKRLIINAEKHKRGCCLRCERVLKEGEECAFHFDHRDPTTKFIRNGKAINPSDFVDLPKSLFYYQWPLEQAKCDLLCANCDKLKTFECKDGYRK